MWAGLACLCLCILPSLGHGFNWTTALNASNVAPEPRSLASLSGFANESVIYVYGGFSHSRNAWLTETWKLQVEERHPQWAKLAEGPFQHASLVNLDGVVLLVGGRNDDGRINDKLYWLNVTTGTWMAAKVKGDAAPPLYRHTAVSYTVDGLPRVLLCGGLKVTTNATVNDVYELSYDVASAEYMFEKLSNMPQPLFGHSLAVGANSKVYVSGGISGSFEVLPTAALPPKLAQLMDVTGEPSKSTASASARVFEFTRGLESGNWSELGTAPRPSAFHASWIDGDALYMHGGVQGRAENSSAAPHGLQIVNILNAAASPSFYNLTAVNEALGLWGDLQPGNVSGAAVWVNSSSTDPLQARVWMFGGWATPQPLPIWTDSYLSPQDSSLIWRLNSSVSRWLAPLQGGMAPRGAAGLLAVPMRVRGARKMLVLGGRAAKGWTGAMPGDTALSYALSDLPLSPLNDPLDSARAYQLYDMWLIDQVTGEREVVWNFACPAYPLGSLECPTAVGRLWDRRLLEFYDAEADPGGSAAAIYLQAEEMAGTNDPNSAKLQPGIWKLELDVINLSAADGPFNATVATWTSLLPKASTPVQPGVKSCYPRVLYGAAHLVSMIFTNTSYIALHGGLVTSNNSLWNTVSSSVCLLELGPVTRWLLQPNFAYAMPQARYRHACASRTGLKNYAMTCYGGWGNESGRVLEDAWTLTLPGGVSVGAGMTTFIGEWSVAHANYTALRPGPRIDHWMLPVRGVTKSNSSSSAAEAFSPVLLVGGSATAVTGRQAPLPHQPIWLLDSAACADPDAPLSNSTSAWKPDRRAQVWLSLLPRGTLPGVANTTAGAEPPLHTWALAAAAIVKTESCSELWLLLAEASEGAVGDVRAIKAVASSGGCLSASERPYCGTLLYSDDVAMRCWSGAELLLSTPGVTLSGSPDALKLQSSSGGFTLVDPDGATVPFKGVDIASGSFRSGIMLPPGLKLDDLTLVAYGRPYIYLGNTSAGQNWTLSLPPPYKVIVQLRLPNGTLPSSISIELRVRDWDGLDRKRRSDNQLALNTGPDIKASNVIASDLCTTGANGTAEFYVMNTSFMHFPGVVSYVVAFTLPDSVKQYTVQLKSPNEAATTTVVMVNGKNTNTLPNGGTDGVYITFNVTFESPNGTELQLPELKQRNWTAEVLSLPDKNCVYNFSSPYFNKTVKLPKSLPPGDYSIQMYDANCNTGPGSLYYLKASTDFVVQDNNMPTVSVVIPVSSVWLNVNFNGSVAPGILSFVKPTNVWVRLFTMKPTVALWSQSMLGRNDNLWALLPEMEYMAEFYFPCSEPCSSAQEINLHNYNFTTPSLLNGIGTYLPLNIILPLTLLCGRPQWLLSPVLNFIENKRSGMFLDSRHSVAYINGTNCTWRINTGQPVADFRIMYSGWNGTFTIRSDKLIDVLKDTTVNKLYQVLVSNVSIEFVSNTNGVMENFQVSWEGHGIRTSMPPQFIMMIAASSAAAGAMLLFLCLWHCVFRPVQMRRQQVAAAMAAAASAAVNAAGNAPGGRGGNRNRVPRRYLRMMTTSVYSVRDAAAAVTASAQAAAASVTSKDALKVCTSDGAANKDADTTSAVAELPGHHRHQGILDAARERRALERPTSARLDKPQPAPVAVVVTAGAVPTVGPMTSLPAPPSSSGPGSHSEPEASGGEICAICLSEFEDGEHVKHLPCKHFYHVACIDQWLGRDITCPLCKDNVLDALKSLFGPLPARGGNARQGRVGDEDAVAVGVGTAVAAAPAPAVPGGDDIRGLGGGAGRAVSGSGAANGGDLEMVVILPYDPAAPGGNGSGGRGILTELPGSVTTGDSGPGRHSVGHGLTAAVTNRAGSSISSGQAGVMASAAAAGAVAMAAGPAGPVSSSDSRELRPTRRNISADLTADQEGTSSDCDSGDDSEYDNVSHQPRHGSRVAAAVVAGAAAANNTARSHGFRSVRAPPPMPLGSGAEVAATRENQFALAVLSQSGSGATASPGGSSYFETAGLAPSPRPVVEHVQRSPFSSSSAHSTGMRWMPSQVAPRLSTALVGGPTVHRLARAQEAQMAVAAAALSAAAAGISSGGISSGAGGSGAGAVGINSWRTASSTSVCGIAPPPIQCFDGAASGGTDSVMPYRVHNNPLALGSAGSRSDADSVRPTDAVLAPAFPGDQLIGTARLPATVNPASSASLSRIAVSPAPHAMSILSNSHARSQGTSYGVRPRRPSSAGIPIMQPRALPEVSASCDDIIRVATSASTPASPQQQHGRTSVIGLWGSAGHL